MITLSFTYQYVIRANKVLYRSPVFFIEVYIFLFLHICSSVHFFAVSDQTMCLIFLFLFFLFSLFGFYEAGFLYIAFDVLELTLYTMLASNEIQLLLPHEC